MSEIKVAAKGKAAGFLEPTFVRHNHSHKSLLC